MSDYTEFFLNSNSSVVQLELLEISHSLFSKVYRIVRNAVNGVTVTHETSVAYEYSYYPTKIESKGVRDDLDNAIQITVGDLGMVIPNELDLVSAGNGYSEKPKCTYRTYKSNNLAGPLFGPLKLEIDAFAFNKEGATFLARAPSLNVNKTGELYLLERFPMLRGFL